MNSLSTRFKKLKNRKGFTLVELIVVIVIIGILAAIMIPRLSGFTDKAKATQAVVDAKEVATAYDSYYAEYGQWTDTSTADVEDYVVKLSGIPIGQITLNAGAVTVETADGKFSAGRSTSQSAIVSND